MQLTYHNGKRPVLSFHHVYQEGPESPCLQCQKLLLGQWRHNKEICSTQCTFPGLPLCFYFAFFVAAIIKAGMKDQTIIVIVEVCLNFSQYSQWLRMLGFGNNWENGLPSSHVDNQKACILTALTLSIWIEHLQSKMCVRSNEAYRTAWIFYWIDVF